MTGGLRSADGGGSLTQQEPRSWESLFKKIKCVSTHFPLIPRGGKKESVQEFYFLFVRKWNNVALLSCVQYVMAFSLSGEMEMAPAQANQA